MLIRFRAVGILIKGARVIVRIIIVGGNISPQIRGAKR